MGPSRYNIISGIPDSDQYVIANLLSGNADIISAAEVNILRGYTGQAETDELIAKGYVIDPDLEKQQFQLAYIDFLEQRSTEEVQVFFAPTYACNFRCSYCYQSPYGARPEILSDEVIHSFFGFINSYLAQKKKYITLFGGEPFLNSKPYMAAMELFLQLCKKHNLEVAAVTNGYHLDKYLPLLEQLTIREIQLTLDGPEAIHNQRRPHKGGKPSFQKISAHIDSCLSQGITVNLRVVLDKDNITALPELARYAMKKGWTESPHFKTQLGRNYELHHCHAGTQKLYSRLSLYGEIYQMIKTQPEILAFHRPGFSAARFLKDNGQLPPPLFDACPGCKTEWAFDYRGHIYSCTATVGKKGEELGQFYPQVKLDHEKITSWQRRDVISIEECTNCNLQLLCGGGCAAVAKNRKGCISAADCRPVDQLLGMGIATYF